ncbi:MAG: sugar kinase [Armatimonadota bacterium]|nr:sugar kinase [Armatimonadota bacterium]
MSTPQVVTLGEALMVFNGPHHGRLERGADVAATFAGAESNLAIGLARLGHGVRWLSVVGDDPFGRDIVRNLRGEGVDVSQVKVSADAPTAVMFKNRRAWAEPEVFYYRAGSAFSRATTETFDPASWRDAQSIYLTGITPALSASCLELMRHVLADARQCGIPVWLDPNYRRKLWSMEQARATLHDLLPHVNVVLAGFAEGQMLTGESEAKRMAAALLDLGPAAVVLKAGVQGAYYFSRNAEEFAPTFAISQVIDPIGAGDGFAAGFLSATLDGLSPAECLQRGHAVGALVNMTEGDWEGLPTRAELAHFLSQSTESVR